MSLSVTVMMGRQSVCQGVLLTWLCGQSWLLLHAGTMKIQVVERITRSCCGRAGADGSREEVCCGAVRRREEGSRLAS